MYFRQTLNDETACASYIFGADHVSGLPELVERTGATAYMPEGAGVEFDRRALADGELVKLGNTVIQAVATPGSGHPSSTIGFERRPALT